MKLTEVAYNDFNDDIETLWPVKPQGVIKVTELYCC